MKKMITSMLAALLLTALMAGPVLAQKRGIGIKPAKHEHFAMLQHLQQEIRLTDDQVAKIKSILTQGHQQIQSLKKGQNPTDRDNFARIQQIRKQMHKDVLAVLTPEQRRELKQARKKRSRIQPGIKPPRP